MENRVGVGFKLPSGKIMYIVSSRPRTNEEEEIQIEIKGLHFILKIGDKEYPLVFGTVAEAMICAYGIQWGLSYANI